MKKNPYTLVFGKEPAQTISRAAQSVEVTEMFSETPSPQQVYMITGLRGMGKTVFMTEIAAELEADNRWVVVELSSSSDLLRDFAAHLASEDAFARIFQKAKINLSFFGIGLEVSGTVPITNIQVALTKMLESLGRQGKRILVCIDEVIITEHMIEFASIFQIFIRQNLPVYLLMTGLYENINNLRNEKNLTFLYRAPRIELKPLNIGIISENYKRNFNLNDENALLMARLTKGYSFAFQVMGYFTWRYDGDYEKALPEVKAYLDDYVYDKIWSELSGKDRRLCYGVAKSKTGKAKEIKEIVSLADNVYSPYRDRLLKRGVLTSTEHGYVAFTLPFFDEYVIRNYVEHNAL